MFKFKEHSMDFGGGIALSWDNTNALYGDQCAEEYEQLMNANDKVLSIVMDLINAPDNVTPHQRDIMILVMNDMNQHAIAKKLNLNQSTVVKTLHGNPRQSNPKIIDGGCRKKVRNLCLTSNEYRLSIKELFQLGMGGSTLHMTQTWFTQPNLFHTWMNTPLDSRVGLSYDNIKIVIQAIVTYYTNSDHKHKKILIAGPKITGISTQAIEKVNYYYFDEIVKKLKK